MTKFEFFYDIDRDLDNWEKTMITWRRDDHGAGDIRGRILEKLPEDLREYIISEKSYDDKVTFVRKMLQKWEEERKECYDEKISYLEKGWGEIKEIVIPKLEKLFEKPFNFEKVTINPTTLPVSPYNMAKSYLMCALHQEKQQQLKTIIHELFHFMTHRHYDEYIKSKTKDTRHYSAVKEALTVYINSDFKELNLPEDKGYPNEHEVREELLKLDRSKMTFIDILDKLIEWTRI